MLTTDAYKELPAEFGRSELSFFDKKIAPVKKLKRRLAGIGGSLTGIALAGAAAAGAAQGVNDDLRGTMYLSSHLFVGYVVWSTEKSRSEMSLLLGWSIIENSLNLT